MSANKDLIKRIFNEYSESVDLSPDARYLHGTPLKPVVPLDQGQGGLFVLGAYPSARFAQMGHVSNVPIADNLGPFESERWFDGSRVRIQPSAKELHDLFLDPLEIKREDCWITDLVKVFLFKPGHVDKYQELGFIPPAGYTRDRFFELGVCSMNWFRHEVKAAQPKLVITLGAEVAGVLRGVRSRGKQSGLLKPEIHTLGIDGLEVPVMHCAHPGILMRKNDERNKWPERHKAEFLPALKEALAID